MTPTPELRNPAEVRCTAAPPPHGESVQTLGRRSRIDVFIVERRKLAEEGASIGSEMAT